jgi:hypothetical protein
VRGQLGILDRAIGQSSVSLSRRLRLAKGMFGLKVDRPPWARPSSLALRSPRPTSTVAATPRMSLYVARQYRPSRASLGSFRGPVITRPSPDMRPLPSWVTSPWSKAPIAVGSHIRTRPRQVNRPASRQIVTTAPMTSQSHRTPVTQAVALEAIVPVLAPRLSGLGQTVRKSRFSSEYALPASVPNTAAVAPSGDNYTGDEPFGAEIQLANTAFRAISARPPAQTSTVSRRKAARSDPNGPQDGTGKEHDTRQGDLYLEGSVLGRWLTQHLNREIIRPRAGIVAVDPRITPSWGGPSLGT